MGKNRFKGAHGMGTNNKRALSASTVCEWYDVDPGTLANLRSLKRGPKFYKVNRKVFYRPEDIEQWLFGSPVQTVDSVREG